MNHSSLHSANQSNNMSSNSLSINPQHYMGTNHHQSIPYTMNTNSHFDRILDKSISVYEMNPFNNYSMNSTINRNESFRLNNDNSGSMDMK